MSVAPGLKSEIDRMLDDAMSKLVSGEYSRWFVDSDSSLSSSDSDDDELYRPCKGGNESEIQGKGEWQCEGEQLPLYSILVMVIMMGKVIGMVMVIVMVCR